jgi:hypothetical protein
VIEVHWLPLREAWGKAVDGEYQDGKTLVGLLRSVARLARGDLS